MGDSCKEEVTPITEEVVDTEVVETIEVEVTEEATSEEVVDTKISLTTEVVGATGKITKIIKTRVKDSTSRCVQILHHRKVVQMATIARCTTPRTYNRT